MNKPAFTNVNAAVINAAEIAQKPLEIFNYFRAYVDQAAKNKEELIQEAVAAYEEAHAEAMNELGLKCEAYVDDLLGNGFENAEQMMAEVVNSLINVNTGRAKFANEAEYQYALEEVAVKRILSEMQNAVLAERKEQAMPQEQVDEQEQPADVELNTPEATDKESSNENQEEESA